MSEARFNSYDKAINAALDWLRNQDVQLEEVFETRKKSFGMRSLDRSGGYRIEFDDRSQAHINVWSHSQKGPHYTFPGNKNSVISLFRQLYFWDPKIKWRSQPDHKI